MQSMIIALAAHKMQRKNEGATFTCGSLNTVAAASCSDCLTLTTHPISFHTQTCSLSPAHVRIGPTQLPPSFTLSTNDRHMWRLTRSAFAHHRNYWKGSATFVPHAIWSPPIHDSLDNSGEKSDLDREDGLTHIVKHPSEWTVWRKPYGTQPEFNYL